MPGDADQGRTATVSYLKEEVRIMGYDPQVLMTMLMAWMFNIVVVDQLIRDSTIVTRSFAGPVEGSCAGLHTTQCLDSTGSAR